MDLKEKNVTQYIRKTDLVNAFGMLTVVLSVTFFFEFFGQKFNSERLLIQKSEKHLIC